MQYAFISNPIKKLQLLFFMNEIYEQRAEKILKDETQYTISLYLEKQVKKKKQNTFQKHWLQSCLTTVSGIRKRYKLKSVNYQKIVS